MVRLAAAESNAFMSDCSDTLPSELISSLEQKSEGNTSEGKTNLEEVASKLANISMLDTNSENDYVEVLYITNSLVNVSI